jgi:hypothetical protein
MDVTETTYRYLDHEVLVVSAKHREAGQWCKEQFGRRWEAIGYRSGRWSMFWGGRDQPKKYRFCFALEQDKLMFMLRWL